MQLFSHFTPLSWFFYTVTLRGSLLSTIQSLCDSQWNSREQIAQYQLKKFQDIIEFAIRKSPYYKNTFSQIGLTSGRDFSDFRYLDTIPILTKDIIRNQGPLLTPHTQNLIENQTGGSTGVPLTFFASKKYLSTDKIAASIRAYTTAGYRRGDRFASVWGYDNNVLPYSWVHAFVRKYILRFYEINAFAIDSSQIRTFVNRLYTDTVLFIKGYANALCEIATFITHADLPFQLKLKAVFSEAERLDSDNRKIIEQAFHTEVFNLYGCRELGTIAVECTEHDGLHTNFEHLYVELTTEGKLLITSFYNFGTPFIRYEIGDYATSLTNTQCTCGRSSVRINKIIGRESDIFKTTSGKKIHGEFFTHLFYKAKGISQFQVIQKSLTHLLLNVVTQDSEEAHHSLETIELEIKKHFGSNLTIDIDYVQTIKKTPSGKMKFTISEIL